jgi:PQQ-dependent catabolism-associated CXXCW motif protein
MRSLCSTVLVAMTVVCGYAAADEDVDFGVPPAHELRLGEHSAPTPRELPGARTIRTLQLKAWLEDDGPARPLLFDVLGGTGHDTLPGAIWLPGAGRGESLADALQGQLARTLAALTGGDPARPLVFFCAGVQCWLSYNAALRAAALGYRGVYWYRGGIEAWVDSGGELAPARLKWADPLI